jgi:hypothetical protein
VTVIATRGLLHTSRLALVAGYYLTRHAGVCIGSVSWDEDVIIVIHTPSHNTNFLESVRFIGHESRDLLLPTQGRVGVTRERLGCGRRGKLENGLS